MTDNTDHRTDGQLEHAPEEVREIIPQLQGEPDEDPVLDAQEAAAEAGMAAEGGQQSEDGEEYEEEFIDADDLLALLGEMKDMLEAQGKEIRGLRREMRELRESQGQGGFRAQGDRAPREGGQAGGFRPREDRGGFGDRGGQGGGFRPREDRGGFSNDRGGDRGGQGGGFRPREDRGGFGDREFRPRDNAAEGGNTDGGFRPRARADRGWSNKRTDEE